MNPDSQDPVERLDGESEDRANSLRIAPTRMIRRQRIMLIIAAGATILSISGLLTSLAIKSPGQAAADRSSLPRSTLTATVEKGVLQSTVTVRGHVCSTKTISVRPVFATTGTAAIVTGLPFGVGEAVSAGDVVAQISGRPVIVLTGDTPSYRDMLPGAHGDDIRELQAALAAIGYLPAGATDGTFGPATKAAVSALYRDRGFEAMTTSSGPATSDPVDAANDELIAAERRLALRKLALEGAADDPARAELLHQIEFDEQDVARAEAKRNTAERTTGVRVPVGEVLFIPDSHGVVSSVSSSIGDDLAGIDRAVLTIDVGELAVYSTVPAGSQSAISPGQSVTISDDVHQLSAAGEVTELKAYSKATDAPEGSTVDTADAIDGHPLTVKPVEVLDANWSGRAVRLTIVTSATPTPVLIVPTAAIRSTRQHIAVVTVLRKGERVNIPVATGASSEGRVEVRPTRDGELAEGDKVLTG